MQPEKLPEQSFYPVSPHCITNLFTDSNSNARMIGFPVQTKYDEVSAVFFSPPGKTFQKIGPLKHPFLLRKTLFFHKNYGAKRFLPFCLLLFIISLPAAVLIRWRKPWVLFFFKLLG